MGPLTCDALNSDHLCQDRSPAQTDLRLVRYPQHVLHDSSNTRTHHVKEGISTLDFDLERQIMGSKLLLSKEIGGNSCKSQSYTIVKSLSGFEGA